MNSKTPKAKKTNDTTFQVPVLKTFTRIGLENVDLEKVGAQGEKLRKETLPILKDEVAVALDWLEKAQMKPREERELLKNGIEKTQKWLAEYLGHEFDSFRRTAWLALLLHHFSKPFKNQKEVEELLDNLCSSNIGLQFEFPTEKGYLHKTSACGPLILTIFGKDYLANSLASFDEQEIRQLRNAIEEIIKRVEREIRLAYQNKINAVLDQGELSTKELLSGETGLFSALASANGSGPKGAVLIYSHGSKKDIFVRQAEGPFQKEMEELKRTNKALFRPTLEWDEIAPDFFTTRERLTRREEELVRLLWKILKSGIDWRRGKEWVQSWRQRLQQFALENKAISPEEFFIDGKTGFCFLEHEEKWDWIMPTGGETSIYDLFFVVERSLQDGKPAIQLAIRTPWLKEFFAGYPNQFLLEGENFNGLPQNLRLVLRKIRGQVEKRSQIQQHA